MALSFIHAAETPRQPVRAAASAATDSEQRIATFSSIAAGATLCRLSGWSVSNLRTQKLLYIAHMLHLGRHGAPLISDHFEAWMYGPVAPRLYRRIRGFGSDPVEDVFFKGENVPEATSQYDLLAETVEAMGQLSSGHLVSLTHWNQGAWSQIYKDGERGDPIPNTLILREYHARQRQQARAQ